MKYCKSADDCFFILISNPIELLFFQHLASIHTNTRKNSYHTSHYPRRPQSSHQMSAMITTISKASCALASSLMLCLGLFTQTVESHGTHSRPYAYHQGSSHSHGETYSKTSSVYLAFGMVMLSAVFSAIGSLIPLVDKYICPRIFSPGFTILNSRNFFAAVLAFSGGVIITLTLSDLYMGAVTGFTECRWFSTRWAPLIALFGFVSGILIMILVMWLADKLGPKEAGGHHHHHGHHDHSAILQSFPDLDAIEPLKTNKPQVVVVQNSDSAAQNVNQTMVPPTLSELNQILTVPDRNAPEPQSAIITSPTTTITTPLSSNRVSSEELHHHHHHHDNKNGLEKCPPSEKYVDEKSKALFNMEVTRRVGLQLAAAITVHK